MRNIPLMRQQNTDIDCNMLMLVLQTDAMPLQLQSTRPHLFTMALCYRVTLHVCTPFNFTHFTEFMLIQCYQVSDYDLDKAKKLIEALYQFKHKAPILFSGLDYGPPKYNHCFFDVL